MMGLRRVLALIIGQTPRSDLVLPLQSNIEAALIAAGADVAVQVEQRGALDGLDPAELLSVATKVGGGITTGTRASQRGAPSSCPLLTRLADGSAVEVEEHHLLPLLQRQLDAAFFPGGGGGGGGGGGANHPVDAAYDAAYTYDAAVVLCAGAFGGLTLQSLPTPLQAALPSPSTPQAPIPVISPFEEAAAVLRARTDAAAAGATLFVPSDAQQPFALARWRGRGGVARFAAPGVLSAATIVHDGETEAEQIVRHLRRGAYGPTGAESTVILDFVGHSPALADELRLRLPGRMVLDVGAVAVQQVVKAVCGGVPVPSKG